MKLNEIVERKKQRINEDKLLNSIQEVVEKSIRMKTGIKNSFLDAIKKNRGLSVIAEVKKASPSKGIISEDFNYIEIAQNYEKNGAAAISVLTEKDFFKGDDKYLEEIKARVSVPILKKDFIVDEYQIYQV